MNGGSSAVLAVCGKDSQGCNCIAFGRVQEHLFLQRGENSPQIPRCHRSIVVHPYTLFWAIIIPGWCWRKWNEWYQRNFVKTEGEDWEEERFASYQFLKLSFQLRNHKNIEDQNILVSLALPVNLDAAVHTPINLQKSQVAICGTGVSSSVHYFLWLKLFFIPSLHWSVWKYFWHINSQGAKS